MLVNFGRYLNMYLDNLVFEIARVYCSVYIHTNNNGGVKYSSSVPIGSYSML